MIFISLKDVKHASWEETFTSLKRLISEAVRSHPYLLEDSVLDDAEKENYQAIAYERGDSTLYERSLYLLMQRKYFTRRGKRNWVFFASQKNKSSENNSLTLSFASDTAIKRHGKIRAGANPYDPEFKEYFQIRSSRQRMNHYNRAA